MSECIKVWLKDVAIRCVKTMAETAMAVIGSAAYFGDVDWALVASATALSCVTCILFNLKAIEAK